jgi:hypothetical protein
VFVILPCICGTISGARKFFGSTNITDADIMDRTKLSGVDSYSRYCIQDELGWFTDPSMTGIWLEEFYNETGVQPYIYLHAYDGSLTTMEDKKAFAENLFTDLGLSGNTFLYVYFAEEDPDTAGYMCCTSGEQAITLMDEEATAIFKSCLRQYLNQYLNGELSADDAFLQAFSDTAENIMTPHVSMEEAKKIVFVYGGLILVLVPVFVLLLRQVHRETLRSIAADKEERDRAGKTGNGFSSDMHSGEGAFDE